MKTHLAEWVAYRQTTSTILAQVTKVPEKMILKYLDGKPTPSLQDATLLAGALEITVDELINKTPEEVEAERSKALLELQNQENEEDVKFFPITTITTDSFTEVVRFRNYCDTVCAELDICVVINDDTNTTSYIMAYPGEDVLDFASLAKITKKRKYSDKELERMTSDARYEGMTVIHVGNSDTNK